MTSFKEVDQVKFELPCVLTWGIKKDKHFGYSIPVVPDGETATKIEELSEKNSTKSPLYGDSDTIYLRVSELTPKQEEELLDKGRLHILIHFTLKGVNTAKNDVKYLSFRVTKLRKVEKSDEDSCAED